MFGDCIFKITTTFPKGQWVKQLICYYMYKGPWGHFKSAYKLLNLRALKFSPVNEIHFFQWMGKIFWNSTQNILPIHWKIWFLYNIEILKALRFTRKYAVLKRPLVIPRFHCVGYLLLLGEEKSGPSAGDFLSNAHKQGLWCNHSTHTCGLREMTWFNSSM